MDSDQRSNFPNTVTIARVGWECPALTRLSPHPRQAYQHGAREVGR